MLKKLKNYKAFTGIAGLLMLYVARLLNDGIGTAFNDFWSGFFTGLGFVLIIASLVWYGVDLTQAAKNR